MDPLSRFNRQQLDAIHRALTSYQGSDERWLALSGTGATDQELVQFLRIEMGIGGSSGPGKVSVAYSNSPPRIWLGTSSWSNVIKPTLSGTELIAVARRLFDISYPPPQATLFESH